MRFMGHKVQSEEKKGEMEEALLIVQQLAPSATIICSGYGFIRFCSPNAQHVQLLFLDGRIELSILVTSLARFHGRKGIWILPWGNDIAAVKATMQRYARFEVSECHGNIFLIRPLAEVTMEELAVAVNELQEDSDEFCSAFNLKPAQVISLPDDPKLTGGDPGWRR